MTCEELAHGKTFLHTLDPRIKIVVLSLASIVIATLDTMNFAALAFFSGVFLLFFARLPYKPVMWRVLAFNTFCLLLWLTVPITTNGKPIFHLFGPINISWEGGKTALIITLKSNAILFYTLGLIATSEITQITHALSHLRCPPKVVQLFFFTWRYIHVITEEAKKLRQAMLLRGFHPSLGIRSYRFIGYLVSAIFIKSYDIGVQVQRAMELRGFNGTFWLIHHFTINKKDCAFMIFSIIFITLIFIGDHFAAPF